MQKKVIQVYKNFDQWKNSPPGLGDFIRGSCHLHELMSSVNVDFKIDISPFAVCIYLIEFEIQNKLYYKKIIKE